MKISKLFIPALVVILAGCSAYKSEEDSQFAAAQQCANAVHKESKAQAAKGISGQYKYTSIPLANTTQDGAFISAEVRSVPYATSSYLDNGVEGSAWQKCMGQTTR